MSLGKRQAFQKAPESDLLSKTETRFGFLSIKFVKGTETYKHFL